MNSTDPVIRSYGRDGIEIAVMRELNDQNNVKYWLVRWDGKTTGKRGCTSPLTSWARVLEIFHGHSGLNPTVEQHACGGFAF